MGWVIPTVVSRTRGAFAESLNLPMRRDLDIVAALYARFASRRMKMPENNAKQGDIITGAIPLENAKGTAPGQWLEGSVGNLNKVIILLPGPPHELRPMFDAHCFERLRARLTDSRQFMATRLRNG